MRVVALFRVSTERQEAEGASLDAQQRHYRRLAETHRWETVAECRGQESATGAATERRILQVALEHVRADKVDAIWVYEQSRLTRADELEVAMLVRELRERRISVIVGTSFRDLSDVGDSFAFGVQTLVDHAESQRIRERSRRGRREKARAGKWASGAPPYGYRNPPPGDPQRGILQAVPGEAEVVRRIFTWRAEGVTLGDIVDRLCERRILAPSGKPKWGKSMIARLLRNPAYRGAVALGTFDGNVRDMARADAIVVDEAHEAIVDQDLWDAAKGRRQPPGRASMLGGFLSIAGKPAEIARTNDGSPRYRPVGGGMLVHAEPVNDVVWRAFGSLLVSEGALEAVAEQCRVSAGSDRLEAEKARIKNRIGKLETRIAGYADMRADGEISGGEFATYKHQADQEVFGLRRALRGVTAEIARQDGDHLVRAARAVLPLVSAGRLTAKQRRRLLSSVVAGVDVRFTRNKTKQPRGAAVDPRKPWRKWLIDEVDFLFDSSSVNSFTPSRSRGPSCRKDAVHGRVRLRGFELSLGLGAAAVGFASFGA